MQIDYRGPPLYKTALCCVVKRGDETSIQMLLAAKADVNNRSIDSATPLIVAAKLGREGVVRPLIGHGKAWYDTRDANGCTALLYAASAGYEGIVRRLLETGKVDGNTADFHCRLPLSHTAERGYEEICTPAFEDGGGKDLLWRYSGDWGDAVGLCCERGSCRDCEDVDGYRRADFAYPRPEWPDSVVIG